MKVKTIDMGVGRGAGEEVKDKKGGGDERKKTTDFNAEDAGSVTGEQSQGGKQDMKYINK